VCRKTRRAGRVEPGLWGAVVFVAKNGNGGRPNTEKPEGAYFVAEGGKRTGILIINMDDASQIPVIAEPWFLALNASIEVTPAMVTEDLGKAGPALEQAAKTYG
jgi:hypothetical protein